MQSASFQAQENIHCKPFRKSLLLHSYPLGFQQSHLEELGMCTVSVLLMLVNNAVM
jgi:hypothetical protein